MSVCDVVYYAATNPGMRIVALIPVSKGSPFVTVLEWDAGLVLQSSASEVHEGVIKPVGGNVPLPARCTSIYKRLDLHRLMFQGHEQNFCNFAHKRDLPQNLCHHINSEAYFSGQIEISRSQSGWARHHHCPVLQNVNKKKV